MLSIIVFTIFTALVLNIILKKAHLPTIIGYILTGTIIAYVFDLHDAVNNHELKEIAEFGVVFLMFTIGLEFSIEHLKKMKNEVFLTGTLQIVITASIVYAMSHYIFGIEQQVSFIIALAIALSSTAIVLKTFNETGEINKRYGQRSLGILIMQDIAVIPILLIIGFMSNSDAQIDSLLIRMFLSATFLLLFLWLIGRYFLEPFFNQIVKTNSDELFVGTILFLAMGASYLAHALGFSYSLGAFIAGMLIAETKYKHQAEADLIPFRDLLLGIFFITVGMQIKFDIIASYIHIVLALLVGVVILKFVIIYFIIHLNESKRVSIKTALSLVQVGEFSLALLELARSYDLIGPPYGQIMIITIVLSMILTPIILKNLSNITDKFVPHPDENEHNIESSVLKNHVVILGFGEFGRNIAHNLKENDCLYVAIENNLETYQRAKKENESVIFGNATNKEILKNVQIQNAAYVIVAIDNPKKLYNVCTILHKYVSLKKIIVKIHNSNEKSILNELGIDHIVIENELASSSVCKLIAQTPTQE
ncbi:cation:proton antiporter [Candidatus Marinarcus aquaticus]|uniref:Sodium:proton exchanger n=1 Tax=Candidatus Marinarcus aquaticus TaxID=2044504 RepID=A0A4Q0XTW6_9BACT|nr:cation:proton antiporter [Candidatus Marinarcus aquaticus]RXJ60543.1 sodium:proton exchanger [Candidatus Marinarcus aquaticus]